MNSASSSGYPQYATPEDKTPPCNNLECCQGPGGFGDSDSGPNGFSQPDVIKSTKIQLPRGVIGSTDPVIASPQMVNSLLARREYSSFPIRYFNGEIRLVVEDLASLGFGEKWGHTRSYSNKLTRQDMGDNGNSWFIKELPMAASRTIDGEDPHFGTIALMGVIQDALWFEWNESEEKYEPQFYVKDQLVHSGNELFHTDTRGRTTVFYDLNANPSLAGRFKWSRDPYGNQRIAQYADETFLLQSVEQSGVQDEITVTAKYSYEHYLDPVHWGMIKKITLAVKRGEAAEKNMRQVEFTYHTCYELF